MQRKGNCSKIIAVSLQQNALNDCIIKLALCNQLRMPRARGSNLSHRFGPAFTRKANSLMQTLRVPESSDFISHQTSVRKKLSKPWQHLEAIVSKHWSNITQN